MVHVGEVTTAMMNPVLHCLRLLTTRCAQMVTGLTVQVLIQLSLLGLIDAAQPPTPQNLTLQKVTPTTATLHWGVEELNNHVHPASTFQMTVESVQGSSRSARVTENLLGSDRDYTLNWLIPETEYRISMRAYDGTGNRSNSSGVVVFRTLAPEYLKKPGSVVVHPGEVVVVLLIVTAWFCAIAKFVHKWSKLRIMHPRDYNWKQQPKNIETIQVVKRHQDSVIYRTYSKRVSKTMQARAHREKRFQRQMTMPNIKVGSDSKKSRNEQDAADRLKSVPLLEVEEQSTDGSTT